MTKTKNFSNSVFPYIGICCLFVGSLCFFSARWFVTTYGRLGFDSVLFTLTAELGGVQSGLVLRYLLLALFPCLLVTALGSLFLLRTRKAGKYQIPQRSIGAALLIFLLSIGLFLFSAWDIELFDYLIHQTTNSKLYEKHYVDPASTTITFPEKKRNLVYIMLESMETTFLSKELGGAMEENLIPDLHDLAQENISFYNTNPESTAGYHTTAGTTWTIGSMVAQTAGIPLKTPTEDVNKYGAEGEAFLPGVTSLTSILHDAGYYQTLMVGSDANFGGRKPYFLQHNMDEVLDIYTARRDGIIPGDYFVWWGMEDLHLFEYAKQELLEIAALDQPFAFTMLTVDTHHVGGYHCELCQDSASGENYDSAISCSSRQVAEFVKWLQAQPFYENTTVIIVGDHESMDNGYIERNVADSYMRRLYNCFINAPVSDVHTKNRNFGAIDLFPTTLAALGCTIKGDRLGLGTNLFGGKKTLMETYGFHHFNDLLSQGSTYYEENFFE